MRSTPTILVVVHDALVGRTIETSLGRMAFEGVFFESSESALDWLREQGSRPSVIALIDLHLSGEPSSTALGYQLHTVYDVPFLYLARTPAELQERAVVASQPHGFLLGDSSDDEIRATLLLATESLRERQETRTQAVPLLTPSTRSEATLITDLSGRITYLNTLAEDLTGWTLAEATRLPYQQVFRLIDDQGQPRPHEPMASGRDRSSATPAILASRHGGAQCILERTSSLTHGDGSLAGLFIAFSLQPTEANAETPAEGFSSLVTGGSESAPPESGGPHAAMLDAVTDPVFTLNRSWALTYANQSAIALLERPLPTIQGKNFWEEFAHSEFSQHRQSFEKAVTTQVATDLEWYLERRERWLELHAYPFADGLVVLLRDVTQRRKEQERASKLEKLESLGLLARGFAHDFNNLLTVLLGNISIARFVEPGETDYESSLDAAKHATEQARNLVQQLLTFAKGGVPITEKLDLNQAIVREVLSQHKAPEHIAYRLELTDAPILVEADPGQIRRLLENLIRNAEEAMLSGGQLGIATRVLQRNSPERLQLPASLDPKTDYALLEVHDTGEGIPDVHLDKIFEPYFSTRTDANATGLGLTVCDSIARSHKGFLSIDSRFGSHTTARLFLPTLRQSWETDHQPSSNGATPVAAANGHHRILILEDEKPIRVLMGLSLKKDGYEVVETAEGSETVSVYSQALKEGRRFDLVIMDLSIPNGMGGAEAIQQIRHTDPAVLAVVSSGYSDDPVMANFEQYGFSAVLPKPYEPSSLRQLAHRLITGEELPLEA